MGKFERPANTIQDVADIKKGDILWNVYGIRIPFSNGPLVVSGDPVRFSGHREYSGVHEGSGDKIVFDVSDERGYADMHFSTDGNLVPGYSHNDNYWFRSEEDALAAVNFIRDQWLANPHEVLAAHVEDWLDEVWMDPTNDIYDYPESDDERDYQ